MVLDGNAVRSVDRAAALLLALGESPGRGRRHRARSPAGPAQVDGLAAAGHAPEAWAGRAGRRDRQVPPRAGRHPTGREGRADTRPARHRDPRARAAGAPDPRDDGHRHPRRRLAPDRGPGRRPEPHRRRRLDRAVHAAPLRRVGQGPDVGAGRARGPADRAARPRELHGANDRRAGAAAGGAGADPAPRLRHGDRRVRAGAQRRGRPDPRRARQRDRGRGHVGPGLPPDPAPHPRAGGPGPRGRRGHLGPPGRHRPGPPTDPGRPPRPDSTGRAAPRSARADSLPLRLHAVDFTEPPLPSDHRRAFRGTARPDPAVIVIAAARRDAAGRPLRPRHRQGAAGPRGDRGHRPGAERGRAQEADGHARRSARPTSSSFFIVVIAAPDDHGQARARHRAGRGRARASSGSPSASGPRRSSATTSTARSILIENQFTKGDVVRLAGRRRHGRGLQPAADDASATSMASSTPSPTARSRSPPT